MAAADQAELELGELLRANTAALKISMVVGSPGAVARHSVGVRVFVHPVGGRVCGPSEYFSECLLERISKRIPASSEHALAQRLASRK